MSGRQLLVISRKAISDIPWVHGNLRCMSAVYNPVKFWKSSVQDRALVNCSKVGRSSFKAGFQETRGAVGLNVAKLRSQPISCLPVTSMVSVLLDSALQAAM